MPAPLAAIRALLGRAASAASRHFQTKLPTFDGKKTIAEILAMTPEQKLSMRQSRDRIIRERMIEQRAARKARKNQPKTVPAIMRAATPTKSIINQIRNYFSKRPATPPPLPTRPTAAANARSASRAAGRRRASSGGTRYAAVAR